MDLTSDHQTMRPYAGLELQRSMPQTFNPLCPLENGRGIVRKGMVFQCVGSTLESRWARPNTSYRSYQCDVERANHEIPVFEARSQVQSNPVHGGQSRYRCVNN